MAKNKYCSRACSTAASIGTGDGASYTGANGYIYVRVRTGTGGLKQALEHRLIWERHNGPIPAGGVIHHINEIKTDNRIENLRLFACDADHSAEHGGWDREAGTKVCAACGSLKPESEFRPVTREGRRDSISSRCITCLREYKRIHERERCRKKKRESLGLLPVPADSTFTTRGAS